MSFLRRRYQHKTTGQALVEFAIVLPIIALLLVMAIDFGRVFFGWVTLQNMSRIGANYVALNADAWKTPTDPVKLAAYQAQMDNDGETLNCDIPSTLPAPVFSNVGGTADTHEVGDHVTVTLTCDFDLITPLAEALLGPVTLQAESVFAIRSGVIAGAPVGPVISLTPITPTPAPQCTVPNFVGTNVGAAAGTWSGAGFTTSLTKSPNNNSWSYIGSQSLAAGTQGPCATTVITVVEGTPPATPTPTAAPTPTLAPTPTPIPQCTVPSFASDPNNLAALQTKWGAAGFVASSLTRQGGPWTNVGSQNRVAGSILPCSSTSIRVGP